MKIVILCGGSGTRLWPLSRELMPKQFVKIFDCKKDSKTSLFAKTLERNLDLCDEVSIITNELHYFLAKDEVEQYLAKKKISFMLETQARNTAPALLLSALFSKKDEIILAIPSDHIINNLEAYKSAVLKAQNIAKNNKIALFGIRPTSAHTGYGYIYNKDSALKFIEKPDKKNAESFLKNGNYFWNSGMFCFKSGVLIDEFKKYNPALLENALKAHKSAQIDGDLIRIKDMEKLENISIDYAIMEKSKILELVIAEFAWSDLGSFDSLKNELSADLSEKIELDSSNNFILSDKLVATIGLKDTIVIDCNDCLLISQMGQSERIKDIVGLLKKQNNPLIKIHNLVYRPWGSYQVLLESKFYKIKQIIVRPNKRLSLQKHFHRNEHWVVVSGSAVVENDGKKIILHQNESTFIPMGSIHRLENQGKIDLVMIEVQVGEYLGEDDIVRIEDDFKRI